MLSSIIDQSKGNNLLYIAEPGLFASIPQTMRDPVYHSGSSAVLQRRCRLAWIFDLFLFLWTGLLPVSSSLQQNRSLMRSAVASLLSPGSRTHMDSSLDLQGLKLWTPFMFPYEKVCMWLCMDLSPMLLKEMSVTVTIFTMFFYWRMDLK